MTQARLLCVGAREHSPRYAEVDRHHVRPKYLAALLGVAPDRRTVLLCSACHDLTHHVLRHRINEGSWGDHHVPQGIRALVQEAWFWWQDTLARPSEVVG